MSPELTIDDKITTFLLYYGITEKVYIDNGAKEMILEALSDDNVHSVQVDNEGALVIEFTD